jgi:hypothetical protein
MLIKRRSSSGIRAITTNFRFLLSVISASGLRANEYPAHGLLLLDLVSMRSFIKTAPVLLLGLMQGHDQNVEADPNYMYAAVLGSGFYRVEDASLTMLRIPLSMTLRETSAEQAGHRCCCRSPWVIHRLGDGRRCQRRNLRDELSILIGHAALHVVETERWFSDTGMTHATLPARSLWRTIMTFTEVSEMSDSVILKSMVEHD